MKIGSASDYSTDAPASVLRSSDGDAATVAEDTTDAWGAVTAAWGSAAGAKSWRHVIGYHCSTGHGGG